MPKIKIINDPVYGFVSLKPEALKIIDHIYFQRLRNIKQLGLTPLVYPGAIHTRFHHAIGAYHLSLLAINNLRLRNNNISDEEELACSLATLLHDIGHGPFSHALENVLIENAHHEDLTLAFMHYLNNEFDGLLDDAIKVFTNTHPKKFLSQLVSSQIDVDRLDYLQRDSFYTGVLEGRIGAERIIKMLDIYDNNIVIEAKGIYSVEQFLNARRIMYWQVYFHKTVIAAEQLFLRILKRAKYLASKNIELFATKAFQKVLFESYNYSDIQFDNKLLHSFAKIDDNDIMCSVKEWQYHNDEILAFLCQSLIERRLPKVELFNEKNVEYSERLAYIQKDIVPKIQKKFKYIFEEEIKDYLFMEDKVKNLAYSSGADSIKLFFNNGQVIDIAFSSDWFSRQTVSNEEVKYYFYYPNI